MAKRNIFEMLGLEFDPPDNVKKIRAAYEEEKTFDGAKYDRRPDAPCRHSRRTSNG